MIDLKTIGIIRSPYKEKFGVPRQPNLVPLARGELHLITPFNHPDCIRGLEKFSHLWLLFIFSGTTQQGWHNTVRPPRLGGNERVGVFASRSTFRPNPIGLSAVELHDIVIHKEQIILKLGSVDLIDQTPIIDIKPYIPYSDSYPDAQASYAVEKPDCGLTVEFSPQVERELVNQLELRNLIIQVIAQDPRPAYKKNKSGKQEFGIKLYHFNIRWQVENNHAVVLNVEKIIG